MKKIVIYQEGSESVQLFDDDGSDISKYAEQLSNLLKSGNVSILNVKSGSFIVRPSKVISILLQEEESHPIKPSKKEKAPPKKNKTEEVDIITDVD